MRTTNQERSVLRTTRQTHVLGRSVMAEFVRSYVKWECAAQSDNADHPTTHALADILCWMADKGLLRL
jgi:hypothetical protein